MKEINIGNRTIGPDFPPFIIAEAGINHEGDIKKALALVDVAVKAKADCVKFQCHIVEAEMIPNEIKPLNASGETIWNLIKRCQLTLDEEIRLKKYCDDKGIIFLSTPFSREAADRLFEMDVPGFKIGSGECNNLPLLEYVASMHRPIILSTGMNDLTSIKRSVEIVRKHDCPLMLMQCTSIYPTPYDKVNLCGIHDLKEAFDLPVGLSDHSIGIYTCLGAVALGACALEKHFTISRHWPGPDIPISIELHELTELVKGSKAIFAARGGRKMVLPEEKPTIDFAYASVVSIRDIAKGEVFSLDNTWVKRPGTGPILANKLGQVLGKRALKRIKKNSFISSEEVAN